MTITHNWFSRFRVVRSIFCMVAMSECTGTAGTGSRRWSRGACPAGGRAPADTAPPSASSGAVVQAAVRVLAPTPILC